MSETIITDQKRLVITTILHYVIGAMLAIHDSQVVADNGLVYCIIQCMFTLLLDYLTQPKMMMMIANESANDMRI